ncbi:ATJ2 [Symbiodinium natans]|uniref:ATJ2 protein n=1 Tax=Symbiodinium natans TaxID=878477 RepID=A0A812HU21_9DINO|nr:ATJ2 [Symbiodinium natans]
MFAEPLTTSLTRTDTAHLDDVVEPPEGCEVNNSRFYELLGISKDASSTEIKKAYHKMAKTHHPDKGGDPDAFKELQRAFEVLSDPEQRQTYDRYGEEGLDEDKSPSGQDFFSQIFGGRAPGRGRAQRPRTKDVIQPIWVTLEELYTGVTRPVPIVRKVVDESAEVTKCDICDGRGHMVEVIRLGPMVQQAMKRGRPMKAMAKAMKAMKVMKKKKESKIARGKMAKMVVFRGSKEKTATGLQKSDLMKNRNGKVVTKKQHAKGKALFAEYAKKWTNAVSKAREELGIKGFCAIGGKSAQGKALYAKARSIYSE